MGIYSMVERTFHLFFVPIISSLIHFISSTLRLTVFGGGSNKEKNKCPHP